MIFKKDNMIKLSSDNWFYKGWLHGLFHSNEPCWDNPDTPIIDEHIDAFIEGFDTARQSLDYAFIALPREIANGHIKVS